MHQIQTGIHWWRSQIRRLTIHVFDPVAARGLPEHAASLALTADRGDLEAGFLVLESSGTGQGDAP